VFNTFDLQTLIAIEAKPCIPITKTKQTPKAEENFDTQIDNRAVSKSHVTPTGNYHADQNNPITIALRRDHTSGTYSSHTEGICIASPRIHPSVSEAEQHCLFTETLRTPDPTPLERKE
jgi:hypothetical protein